MSPEFGGAGVRQNCVSLHTCHLTGLTMNWRSGTGHQWKASMWEYGKSLEAECCGRWVRSRFGSELCHQVCPCDLRHITSSLWASVLPNVEEASLSDPGVPCRTNIPWLTVLGPRNLRTVVMGQVSSQGPKCHSTAEDNHVAWVLFWHAGVRMAMVWDWYTCHMDFLHHFQMRPRAKGAGDTPTRVWDSSSFPEQLSDFGHRIVTFALRGFSSRICLWPGQSLDCAYGSGCLMALFTLWWWEHLTDSAVNRLA